MKAVVGTLNQEKALVGAFSVIVKTDVSFASLGRSLVSPHSSATVSTMSPSSSASGGAPQHAQALLFLGNLNKHYKLGKTCKKWRISMLYVRRQSRQDKKRCWTEDCCSVTGSHSSREDNSEYHIKVTAATDTLEYTGIHCQLSHLILL